MISLRYLRSTRRVVEKASLRAGRPAERRRRQLRVLAHPRAPAAHLVERLDLIGEGALAALARAETRVVPLAAAQALDAMQHLVLGVRRVRLQPFLEQRP